jgi:hypothetical protein
MQQDTWAAAGGFDRRRAMIVTWNPDKTPWADEYFELVEQTAQGLRMKSNWSTGRRREGISKGDRVFMLRQGARGRGIIASGTVVSDIFLDAHWDKSEETANYVDVVWECVVPVENRLSTDVLKRQLPEQHWRPQNSGMLVKAALVGKLEEMWSDHVVRIGRQKGSSGSSGQATMTDPVRRKKIEDAAQARLMKHYRAQGWEVIDTRLGNPYDATAEKSDLVSDPWVVSPCGTTTPPVPDFLYLEAKGTETEGYTVRITPGEVRHARANVGQCVMGIWAGVKFGNDDEVDPKSGWFDVIPFHPHDDDLKVVTYEWQPPNK